MWPPSTLLRPFRHIRFAKFWRGLNKAGKSLYVRKNEQCLALRSEWFPETRLAEDSPAEELRRKIFGETSFRGLTPPDMASKSLVSPAIWSLDEADDGADLEGK
jgi:hypothetical protein